jgi:hypothetical protein
MTHDSTIKAIGVVEAALAEADLPVERTDDHTFVVTLEGAHKLRTTVSLVVGDHALSINAFVARRPDENAEAVYQWLLERNRRMYAVAFCIDHLGDIYLSGRTSLEAVTPEEVDRILGCVAEYSDGSFNTILELGFATAIRREWKWRVDRGEPTGNLEAFRHLAEQPD